jgi:hypothetical protein
VLLAEGDVPVVGAPSIAEYVDETRGVLKRDKRLFAEDPIETRRDPAPCRLVSGQDGERRDPASGARARLQADDAGARRAAVRRMRPPSARPAPTSSSI